MLPLAYYSGYAKAMSAIIHIGMLFSQLAILCPEVKSTITINIKLDFHINILGIGGIGK